MKTYGPNSVFRWTHTDPTELDYYTMYWGNEVGGPYPNSIQVDDPNDDVNMSHPALNMGLTDSVWYAIVTASNAAGESDPSNEIEFRYITKKPVAPTEFLIE